MSAIPPETPILSLVHLSKEKTVPDHNDPSNSAVKPAIDTLEGKIYLAVSLLTALSAALGTVLAAYPESREVKIAALIVSVLMAAASAFAAKSLGADRRDVKQTANLVAGGLAAIDKAIGIAKDHPELAAAIVKSTGLGASLPDPSVPTRPASN